MSGQGLPVSNLINVQVNVSPAGASFQNFNSALIVGQSAVIDLTERLRIYTSLAEVAVDFGVTAPEYLAAAVWFGQSPAPETLCVGRWANTASNGQLIGGAVSAANQALSAWTSITNGAFQTTLNGVPVAITGLNFSAATNLNGVAQIIQTALAAQLAGTTVTWNATYDNFTVTSGTTGVGSTIGFLNSPAAVGSASFSAQPAANDTLTLDGTVVTFVNAAPVGNQVQIGASLPATLQNLLTFASASTDVNISKMTYAVTGSVFYCLAAVAGAAGNAYTLARSSTAITLSGATLTGGTGTDISTLMAGKSSLGAYVANGIAAESALSAVQTMDAEYGGSWYGLAVIGAADSDHLAIAAYIEADATARHYYGVTTSEPGVLSLSSTSDVAYLLSQQKYNHTAVQYSSQSPYAILSYLARILTTNWQGTGTAITLQYKQEPGVTPETLTSSQSAALAAKNCNVYANFNTGTPIILGGYSCSGLWTDMIIGLDWFANYQQIQVFNLLFGADKIPQTDPGNHQIATVLSASCQQGVTNGLFAPGVWNSAGFGTLSQGDALTTGYYVYQPPISSQSQTARAARQSVAFQEAVKLAGAVHDVAITVTVNQ